MRTLRIAFVSPFFPLKGGIARFSSTLLEVLCRQGHEVEAISFRRLYPAILFRGKAVYEPGTSGKSGSDALPLLDMINPLTWICVARRIRRRKPDIILCAYWLGLFAPLYAFFRGVSGRKMIVLMHNFSSHEKFPGEKLLRNLLMASADGVITLSEHVARQVEQSYPAVPVTTLFHPVYNPEGTMPPKKDARRILGLQPQGPVLLFFGYVREYKGLDILIDAMPEIICRYPGARLLIAGEFYYGEKKLRERIGSLGIGGQVKIYAEFVSNERMLLFFSAADVVVLPYREASQSGVVQQAYGFGRPVVVSDRGGLPEAVREGETGMVVRSLEPRAFAEAVCDFFRSREKIPYEEKVKQHAGKLSWEVFAERLAVFAGRVVE
ncbi:MAG: glycosyltransferase [Chlorobiales bacterium]|nr:glycosyltransferase [Chlorobiales bacterium]